MTAQNAVVETFFKTIKSELICRTAFQTRRQAHAEIAQYIDGFYNPVQRHSACGYESLIRYEMMKKLNRALHFYEANPLNPSTAHFRKKSLASSRSAAR